MFTGLIEEIGSIGSIQSIGGGKKIKIDCQRILSDTKIDDSISINGTCQTVTDITEKYFEVVAVEETLRKTTMSNWRSGQKVNLERALKLSDRLGGHLLLGHVDDIGKIINISKLQTSIIYEIQFPVKFSKYAISKGSIAIDGISLTIAEFKNDSLKVSIIPHTLENTVIKHYKVGAEINLEFDLIGKYVERLTFQKDSSSGLTFEKLQELGY
jgi:riboflavin synthase